MVICLQRGADLHMAQLMPLPQTVSCFSKIQIGFTLLVPAHPGSPGKEPLNVRVCMCACVCACVRACVRACVSVCVCVVWTGGVVVRALDLRHKRSPVRISAVPL